MFKHYKLPCLLWAVALVAAVPAAITGENDFTMSAWYGFLGLAETIRRTKILWRRYRRAENEKRVINGKTAEQFII